MQVSLLTSQTRKVKKPVSVVFHVTNNHMWLGNSLLMLAAYSGHADLTTTLLAKGADPNRVNDNGQSPLAGAVFKSELEVIRRLIAGGANPRLGTPTAIQTARIFKREDVLEILGATEDDVKEPLPTMPGPPH